MINAENIAEKVWHVIPDDAKKQWQELPRDVDNHVAHDWLRDVLKPGIIRVYDNLNVQSMEKRDVIEMAGIIDLQKDILVALGMMEVYFSEFKK